MDQPSFRQRTPEEMVQENQATRRKTGLVIRTMRVLDDNPDLVRLGIVIFCMGAVGYFAARIWLGLTAEQIKSEITEFIGFIVFLFLTVWNTIKKIYTQQGVISSSLSGRIDREHDTGGNSVVPKK